MLKWRYFLSEVSFKKSLSLNTTADFSLSPLLLLKVPLSPFHDAMGGSTKHEVPVVRAQWFSSEAPFSPVTPQACQCCRGIPTLAPGVPPALLLPCPGCCRAVPCPFPSLPGPTLPRMKPVSLQEHQQHRGALLCPAAGPGAGWDPLHRPHCGHPVYL